jgi:hypothetical protein
MLKRCPFAYLVTWSNSAEVPLILESKDSNSELSISVTPIDSKFSLNYSAVIIEVSAGS